MAPVDTTSYWSAVVTIALSRTIFELFDVIRGHSRSLEMAPFDRLHTSSHSSSIVTFYRFRNKARYWSKNLIFHTSFYLTCTIPWNLFEFLPKILIQTVQVPELLGGAKILPKSSNLCLKCNNVTDRRQTDDRRTADTISRT